MKELCVFCGVFLLIILITIVSAQNSVTLDTVLIPAMTIRQFLNIISGIIGLALVLYLAVPTYTRARSRRRCGNAFKRISEWTQRQEITKTNVGHYREMARELKNRAKRHLIDYPEDKMNRAFVMYLDYASDAFEIIREKEGKE